MRFGAPLGAQGVTVADFAKPGLVCQMGQPPRRVDVLTEISGVTFDEAYATREPASLEGRTIPYIGREAFVRNKEAAGRPKDLADVSRLNRAKR